MSKEIQENIIQKVSKYKFCVVYLRFGEYYLQKFIFSLVLSLFMENPA